jgi:hypothetical protein
VVGTTLTAAVSLSGGFAAAADRADLPDLIVRFDDERREDVDERLGALPNVEARAYRYEITRVPISAGDGSTRRGALHVVEAGRRGYEIVRGRDVRGSADEVVVEAGVAREWNVALGDTLTFFDDVRREVVGVARSPDNVAFPLAAVPRIYVDVASVPADLRQLPESNLALAWLRDPGLEDETLTQARAVSFGLQELRFITRAGVQVLVGQAAGIVIALLVAFSVVALATSGIMLGASARAEVARRLPSIGVQRAIGFSRRRARRRPVGVGGARRRTGGRVGIRARRAGHPGAEATGCSMRSTRSAPAGSGLVACSPRAGMVALVAAAGRVARLAGDRRAGVGAAARRRARGWAPARGRRTSRGGGGGGGFGALGADSCPPAGALGDDGRGPRHLQRDLILLLALASLLSGLRDDPGRSARRTR